MKVIDKNGVGLLDYFWGIQPTGRDIQDLKQFFKVIELYSRGVPKNKIANSVGRSKSTIEKWLYNNNLPPMVRLVEEYRELGDPGNMKWLAINSTRGGLLKGPWIMVPKKVNSYKDVLAVIDQLEPLEEVFTKMKMFNINPTQLEEMKPLFFAYLLGTLIGDSSKNSIYRKNRVTRRIQLRLSKAYPSNKKFGDFVAVCANSFGLRMNQIKDMKAGKRNPNPFFAWTSQSSALIQWIFRVCLGLENNEVTTYNAIRASWILSAPREFMTWFVQGLADSDGFVDLTSLQVGIITHPNTELIGNIFKKLRVKGTRRLFRVNGLWSIMIKTNDAYHLPVFNPYVKSYRYKLMEKVAKSKRIKGHWPSGLRNKIDTHIENGLSGTKLVNKILDEEGIAIRAQKVNNRIRRKGSGKLKSRLICLGIESTAH